MLLEDSFAKAIELSSIHKRIVYIVQKLGTSRRKIILSFMIATAFLSLIANVVCCTLMLPLH
jgi:di/tricarboxylate transporter